MRVNAYFTKFKEKSLLSKGEKNPENQFPELTKTPFPRKYPFHEKSLSNEKREK